jgi:hypothetical protein
MNNHNNNTAQPSGDTLSWLLVLICLFAAFPLGIILLLIKLSGSSKGKGSGTARPNWQNNRQAYGARQAAPPTQAKTGPAQSAPHPFRQSASNGPARQYQQAQSQPSYQYYNVRSTEDKADKEKAKSAKKHAGKGLSALLMFLGVLFLITGTVFLSLGISSYAAVGLLGSTVTTAIFSALFYSSALFSFIERGIVQKKFRRFNKYAVVIGDRASVSVTEISEAVGDSVKKTKKILQSMIDSGFFGSQAYIDSGLDSLVISREAAETARHAADAAKMAASEKNVGNENPYVAIINELHMLRGKTIDPEICAKIERIEELTVKIFRIVEDKPEKAPQIRRFMNYYLPTTMKLLHSYETLEKQGINGENIMSAKQDIERILDTLATGYEQQLDNLFRADAIDISADINVLENMMEQDGLTNDGNILKTAGGS